ncbi:putative membrane protein [Colletotrichum orbiculare MAFF 240422]|uniref:Membrane protein n=1 Tax=Colletotrichum orbiculare (strain 104-T / ATCC 96160 / CBS 514.97 / LARS 414 / MAFF 240422) TaxID=1213857 RepID=N4V1A7_COLOR|nr:putative membrane protein [Colletotrichum orbiculare MAFF 240422]
MASLIAKFISKQILKEKVENNFGREDPYFETVPATRLDGRPTGKVKKRRKALPPGISAKDGEVLTKVKRRAYRLDMSLFSCCGVRFGWGSVIGLIPAIGDVLDAFMAMMVFKTCNKIEGGLPGSLKSKMMFNIIFDFAVGLVPFVGDIVDAAFRCNTKNAILLEDYLREQGRKNLKRKGTPIPAIDPSEAEEWDRLQEDRAPPEYVAREPAQHGNMSASRSNSRDRGMPAAPSRAKTRNQHGGPTRSFWGFGRARVEDEEMGRETRNPSDRPIRDSPRR